MTRLMVWKVTLKKLQLEDEMTSGNNLAFIDD